MHIMKKLLSLIPPLVILIVAILSCVLLSTPVFGGTYKFSEGDRYASITFRGNHYEIEASSDTNYPISTNGIYIVSGDTIVLTSESGARNQITRNSVFSLSIGDIELHHSGAIALQVIYLVFLTVAMSVFIFILVKPSIILKKNGE